MENRLKKDKNLNVKIFIGVGLLITGYLMFTYAQQVYRDYQVEQQVKSYEADIEQLKNENVEMEAFLEYLKTDWYKEKEAKKTLNVKNPGETVVSIESEDEALLKEKENPLIPDELVDASNPDRWWHYFFEVENTN